MEVLLSMALLAVVAGLSIPVFQKLFTQTGEREVVSSVVRSMYRAKVLSEAMAEDSAWGVNVTSNQIVVYKGASFGSRDSSFDEVTNLSITAGVTGFSDISFLKGEGVPNQTGSMTISISGGDSHIITVNEYGSVSY